MIAHRAMSPVFLCLYKPEFYMSDDFLNSLIAGFCLMLVFEGLLPFIAPSQWRETVNKIAQLEDGAIRKFGLCSMVAGITLLYILV